MTDKQVLIISFWNPTPEDPHKGIFIQDQVEAVCGLRGNVIFLQVNILPGKRLFLKEIKKEEISPGNKKIVINFYSRFWKFFYINPWWSAWIIHRVIKKSADKINPALIHANVIYPCGIAGYILARRTGAGLIISEHWSKAGKLLKNPVYKRIAKRAYCYSSAVIYVSEFLSGKLARMTGQKNAIVIPNIINPRLFTYLPKPEPESSELIFMCVSSWRAPKRLDLIFDALCSYAAETDRQIVLRVVGNGPQADDLKKRITPENLHIEWLGYLDRSEIVELLHKANIFVHPSEIETFSIVTAEALSTGTPVIASGTGALPELINKDNGILTDNNPGSWLNAIKEIVNKQFDHQAIAVENQNKFSPETIGKRIVSVYDKFLFNSLK